MYSRVTLFAPRVSSVSASCLHVAACVQNFKRVVLQLAPSGPSSALLQQRPPPDPVGPLTALHTLLHSFHCLLQVELTHYSFTTHISLFHYSAAAAESADCAAGGPAFWSGGQSAAGSARESDTCRAAADAAAEGRRRRRRGARRRGRRGPRGGGPRGGRGFGSRAAASAAATSNDATAAAAPSDATAAATSSATAAAATASSSAAAADPRRRAFSCSSSRETGPCHSRFDFERESRGAAGRRVECVASATGSARESSTGDRSGGQLERLGRHGHGGRRRHHWRRPRRLTRPADGWSGRALVDQCAHRTSASERSLRALSPRFDSAGCFDLTCISASLHSYAECICSDSRTALAVI